jgi:hypothetical protein
MLADLRNYVRCTVAMAALHLTNRCTAVNQALQPGHQSVIRMHAYACGPKCHQEYLGSYVADEAGRLVFREGALVTALRRGHWVVLDELNLAPTEVLEALNRCILLCVKSSVRSLNILRRTLTSMLDDECCSNADLQNSSQPRVPVDLMTVA